MSPKRKRNAESTPLTKCQQEIKLFRQAAKRYEKYLPKILWQEIERFWMLPTTVSEADANERLASLDDNKKFIKEYDTNKWFASWLDPKNALDLLDNHNEIHSGDFDVPGYVWHPCRETYEDWEPSGYGQISPVDPDTRTDDSPPQIFDTNHNFWNYCVHHVRRGSSKLLVHISHADFWRANLDDAGTYGSVVWMSKKHPGLLGFLSLFNSDLKQGHLTGKQRVRYMYINPDPEREKWFSLVFPFDKVPDVENPYGHLTFLTRSEAWIMEHASA